MNLTQEDVEVFQRIAPELSATVEQDARDYALICDLLRLPAATRLVRIAHPANSWMFAPDGTMNPLACEPFA